MNISIVVVDEEDSQLEETKQFLEKMGDIVVETANSAEAAIDMIRGGNFDVVVSEFDMPEIDGLQLLKILRAEGESIPFIIFTGRSRDEVAAQALQAGADFNITKSLDSNVQYLELRNAIRKLVEKSRTEIELVRSTGLLRMAEENISDILVIIDPRMRLTYISPSIERSLGWNPEEFKAINYRDIMVPEDSKRLAEVIRRISCRPGTSSNIRISIRHKDGSMKTHDCRVSRGLNTSEKSFITIVSRDITSESKLEIEAMKFRQAIDTSLHAVAMTDLDRRMVYVNESFLKLWGTNHEDVLGRHIFDLWQDSNQATRVVNDLQENGKWEGELRGKRQDGGLFDSMVSASVIKDEGEGSMMLLSLFDISEIKKTNRRIVSILNGLKGLSESMGDAILIFNSDSNIIYSNNVASMFLGIPVYRKLGAYSINLEDIRAPVQFMDMLKKALKSSGQFIYVTEKNGDICEKFEIFSHKYEDETAIYVRRFQV